MFTDKTMLVIGAGRGIGRALSLKLAAQGANLVLASRTYTDLAAVAEEAAKLGGKATPITADVTNPHEMHSLVSEAKATYGRIDAIYYGAGVGVLGSALELKDHDLDRMLEVNLKGLFYLTRAAIPTMIANGGGHILVPVGILGRHVMRNSAGYSASKFAVVGLVKALGEEFNRRGMRFTMLYFGGVNTSFWDAIEMKVDRAKMISAEVAADAILYAMSAPTNMIVNEVVMQPDSHQFV